MRWKHLMVQNSLSVCPQNSGKVCGSKEVWVMVLVISLHIFIMLYCTFTNKTRQMVLVLHNDALAFLLGPFYFLPLVSQKTNATPKQWMKQVLINSVRGYTIYLCYVAD